MKYLGLLILLTTMFISSALALDPYSHFFIRRNFDDSGNEAFYSPIPVSNQDGIGILNGSSGWLEFATLGTGFSYDSVNKVFNYTPNSKTVNNNVVRTFNSNFQPHNSKASFVNYSVTVSSSLSLTGGQDGSIILEISPNGSTGWIELSRISNGNTGTLTVGLSTVQTQTFDLAGVVLPGYYVRLRTVNNTGTPTFTYVTGQEVID